MGQESKERLEELVRSSGFYRQKADRLSRLSCFILENYGDVQEMEKQDLNKLRIELLGINGLGLETVDAILLYALDKPVFVIDEYTKRFVRRRKLGNNLSYEYLRNMFEENLTKDHAVYQNFHALIIIEGKTPLKQKLLFKN